MKKATLLFTLLLSTLSFSQQGFIEIEVRDSIKLKATKFEYLIEITQVNEEYNNGNAIEVRKKIKAETKRRYNEIENVLKEKNYNYRLPKSHFLVSSYSYFNKNSFIINLKKETDLKRVKTDFQEFNYINISLKETFFDDESKIEKKLFKKLLQKATKKASMIAELSTLKIDKITSIKEVKEIDNLSFNIMDLYINQNNKNTSGITYINSKAIVVRFSTK